MSATPVDGAKPSGLSSYIDQTLGKMRGYPVKLSHGIALGGLVMLISGIVFAAVGAGHMNDSDAQTAAVGEQVQGVGITFALLGGLSVAGALYLRKKGPDHPASTLSMKGKGIALITGLIALMGIVSASTGGALHDEAFLASGCAFSLLFGMYTLLFLYHARKLQQQESLSVPDSRQEQDPGKSGVQEA